MTPINIWIFEDDDRHFDGLVKDIENAVTLHVPETSLRFTWSQDEHTWSQEKPEAAAGSEIRDEDLVDDRCDAIILDMSLANERTHLSAGLNILKRLERLDGRCRNIWVYTANHVSLRSEHWPEFERLLSGPLCDHIAFWEKSQRKQLIGHLVALLKARKNGIRLPAGLLTYIRSLALSDDSVLLLGQTGVGKEEVAQSIHRCWAAEHPEREEVERNFQSVNCATLMQDLGRGELFGVVRGSYTNSTVHTIGRVLRAAGLHVGSNRTGARRAEFSRLKKRLKDHATALDEYAQKFDRFNEEAKTDKAVWEKAPDSISALAKQLVDLANQVKTDANSPRVSEVPASDGDAGSEAYLAWLRTTNENMCDWHEESLDVEVHLRKGGSTPRARGTLFLDEIGAMPLGVQRALLRFLNDWEVVPIGYEGVIRPKEKGFPLLRVIAATNDPNWIALAKGQSTGRPDWSDLFYRLSRHILHISPPTAAEVDSLIEMERQAIGADGIEWDASAKEELRERVRAGKVQGNRREIRAIARRTMQFVRGAQAGVPVVNPNLVTKRELLLACPTPGKLEEYSPSAALALMPEPAHSSAQATSTTAPIGAAGGSGQPGLIDLQSKSDGYLDLVIAMHEAFEEMSRWRTNCLFDDWKICRIDIFTEHVANRFSNRDLLPLWRRATLRAILEVESRKKNGVNRLDKIFSDIPEPANKKVQWYWKQLEFLVEDAALLEFLRLEKASRPDLSQQAVFKSVLSILQSYAKPDAGGMAEPDELKQKLRQFAVLLFPDQ